MEETQMVKSPFHAARKVLAGVCALMAAVTAADEAVAFQDTGSVMGLVLDDEGLAPVPGALVSLPEFTHHRTRTNAEGWFRLLNVPAGEIVIRVEEDGYGTLVETVEILPMEESLIHFHIHGVSVILDRLLVEVPRRDDIGRGHSEAQVSGTVARSRTAADFLLTGIPGVAAQQLQGGVGTGVRIRLRGVNSFLLSEEPQIYLDGVRIDAGGQDRAMLTLEQIPATSVTRIRVLRGPASTSRYPGAAAGVILVETMGEDE